MSSSTLADRRGTSPESKPFEIEADVYSEALSSRPLKRHSFDNWRVGIAAVGWHVASVPLDRGAILLVSDFFQPSDVRSVEGLLHRNVDHCGRWPCAVPVLLSR